MTVSRFLLGSLFWLAACSQASDQPRAGGAEANCASRAYAQIGGPISLIDHNGNPVTEADFKGAPSLVFFGFRYCPDVCPLALVTIDRALKRLPETVEPPRTLLISVDPERDTPAELKTYVETSAFPDKITGLTGSVASVRAAADAFLTDFEKVPLPDSNGDYTIDHQSIIYLMDENWTLKTFFTHESTDATIAQCLGELL